MGMGHVATITCDWEAETNWCALKNIFVDTFLVCILFMFSPKNPDIMASCMLKINLKCKSNSISKVHKKNTCIWVHLGFLGILGSRSA